MTAPSALIPPAKSSITKARKVQSRQHVYEPRGACKTLFESRADEILLSGPAGTGKSRGCLEKLNVMALKYPGMRGLILRRTAASLGASAIVTWEQHVIKELLETGKVKWFGGSTKEPPCYRYSNGSRIVIGGMDNPVKIMSTEYDVIYIQEAIELSENDWESATSRLRNGRIPYQQLMADTNPDRPTHWLIQRCNKGQTVLVESRHEDNPVYYTKDGKLTPAGLAYIEGKLDKLTGVRKQRLRYGKWVAADGLIYEDYDAAIHLIDWFEIPKEWTRYWVIDFGFTNPFVCQWWAENPDGQLFMYREIYRTQRLVEDHARDMLKLVTDANGKWLEPKPSAIICDHDAEDRATLQKHLGMGTIAAKKTVSDGIQAFASRLKAKRLFILRDSLVSRDESLVDKKKPTCFAEELTGYIWDTGAGKKIKETPFKEDDHSCDTGRYMVAQKDLQPEYNIRWL